VGAMNWEKSPNAAGSFSNYGKKNVDLFAPGVDIYSTFPNQKYEFQQGTSMAAPVVAGVAAVLRSHFPELSASEIKKALLSSVRQFKGMKTNQPGSDKLVNFSDLSKTGGVVELSKAVEYCFKLTQGKK
jgi:subtilisin family serine protease